MTYLAEFQDRHHGESGQQDHISDDFKKGDNADPDRSNPEISLDSPCTETCMHPEHQELETPEESFRDKWLRAAADGENLRRRLEKEKKEGIDYALFRFAKELIAIADQLSWAIASVTTSEGQKDVLYQGVSMTLAELERVFGQFGIVKIDALNHMFNPHFHQVMQEQEDDSMAPGTVLNVLQNGYRMHDRLLRPSMVVVAKNTSTSVPTSENSQDPA
jgi:molecular chaperone GrpE